MTTAGSPVGIAAIAKAIAAVNTVLKEFPAGEVQGDRDDEREPCEDEDLLRELVELPRERRLRVLLPLQEVGDVPDLCLHARRGDDEVPRAAGDVRVHVDHVRPVAERRVRRPDRVGPLRDRQTLSGERRLVDLERGGGQEAPVGGNDIARLEPDGVAGDELFRRNLGQVPVPADAGLDDHHLLKRRDRFGRLALLPEAENGVEQGQEDDQDPRPVLLDRVDAADAGDQQDDLHRISVLAHECAPARLLLGLGEAVGAVLLEPFRGFANGEAALSVGAELRDGLLAAQEEPRRLGGHPFRIVQGCPRSITRSELFGGATRIIRSGGCPIPLLPFRLSVLRKETDG